eukprot:scaffold121817_cov48-Phaeocystis_antarctica.AAC.2
MHLERSLAPRHPLRAERHRVEAAVVPDRARHAADGRDRRLDARQQVAWYAILDHKTHREVRRGQRQVLGEPELLERDGVHPAGLLLVAAGAGELRDVIGGRDPERPPAHRERQLAAATLDR